LRVAGIRAVKGDALLLSEEEARYELLNGAIVPEGDPNAPVADPEPAAEETANADMQPKKKR
jgi:hypothetical protein